MKKLEIDWPYMRKGLPPIAAGAAVTAVLLIAIMVMKSNAIDLLEANQTLLDEYQQQGNEMRGKLDAAQQYSEAFAQLTHIGVVGTEQRLVWVQFFRDTANKLRLPYLRYTADQQRAFSAPWLSSGDTSLIMASKLTLQVGLIHSLDLLRVIDNLRDAPGFFHVSSCQLERVVKDGTLYANKPNILADCNFDWFSIPVGRRAEP